MKRREGLKGLTIAVGGALLPNTTWSRCAQQQTAGAVPPLALPIRGLVKRDGKLLQPIQIALHHSGTSATAVTKLNGAEADRRTVSAGPNTFQDRKSTRLNSSHL